MLRVRYVYTCEPVCVCYMYVILKGVRGCECFSNRRTGIEGACSGCSLLRLLPSLPLLEIDPTRLHSVDSDFISASAAW